MNKIFSLVLSEYRSDNEVAEILLKKNPEVLKHILNVYVYVSMRNEHWVTEDFLINPKETYYKRIHKSGIVPSYIEEKLRIASGQCLPKRGKGYAKAIRSLKILLNE